MVRKGMWLRMAAVAVILSAGFAVEGCTSIRQATGAVKQPPDEFTILTKAPLVLPPDYNLRPPQPGVASRNEVDPDQQAQAALFQPSAAEQAAMLGSAYSDGEKLLLTKSNALTVDPNIRRMISTDAGQEDQGPAFSQKVLYEGAMPPAAATTANPKAVTQPASTSPGFFGRVFGSKTEEVTPPPAPAAQPAPPPAPAPQPVVAPMPAPAPAPAASANPPPTAAPAPMQKAAAPAQEEGWFARNFGIGSSSEPAPAAQPAQAQAASQPKPAAQPVAQPASYQSESWFSRNFGIFSSAKAAPAPQPAPDANTQPPPAQPAPAQ